MDKRFKCCFPNCKFKHDTLIVVMDHLAKIHKLKINGKSIYVRKVDASSVEDGE